MKTLITFLLTVCLASISQGEVAGIKIIPAIKKGDDITSYPTAIVLSGKKTSINTSDQFIQDSQLGTLPVGVIIDAVASFEGKKISYSVLVTIREHKEGSGSTLEKASSIFETHELMLTGVTDTDEKIEAKIDDSTTFIISFEATQVEQK